MKTTIRPGYAAGLLVAAGLWLVAAPALAQTGLTGSSGGSGGGGGGSSSDATGSGSGTGSGSSNSTGGNTGSGSSNASSNGGSASSTSGADSGSLDSGFTGQRASPDVRLGALGSQFGSLLYDVAPTVEGWSITPSLGVTETLTDNVFQTANGRRADIVTSINPSILITGNTPRVQAVVSYSPNINLYAFTAHQNQVNQSFFGDALTTVVPDLFFVDLRGYAAQQSITGGFAPNGTGVLDNQNNALTTSYAISPYLVHRFGGYGVGQAGYTFQYTSQNGNALFTPNNNPALTSTSQPSFVNNSLVANQEYATFRTGENFSRFVDEVEATLTQDSGTGVLSGAYQNYYTNDVAYALDRNIAAIGEIGWEDLHYSGTPGVRIDDIVWYVGARLTPNPKSSIVVRYGHRDGISDAYLNGSYALTARTTIYASYTDGLTTDEQNSQSLLGSVTPDQYGNPLNTQTGAPVLLNNQFFGLQDSLVRQKLFSLNTITAYARDTVGLQLYYLDQTVAANAGGSVGYAQNGATGGITWTHELNPLTSASAYLQYGVLTSGALGSGSSGTFTGALSLNHAFSETLYGSAEYVLTTRSFNTPNSNSVQNAVIFGLRKTF